MCVTCMAVYVCMCNVLNPQKKTQKHKHGDTSAPCPVDFLPYQVQGIILSGTKPITKPITKPMISYRTGFKVSFYQEILFEAKHKMEIHTLLSTVSCLQVSF
jgi:hypothetical protein